MTNEPDWRWEDRLRAALNEQAESIDAVTPWAPPTEGGHNGRRPWRWMAPLAAAAAVLAIAAGAAAARYDADRDVRPAAPSIVSTPVTSTPAIGPTSSRHRMTTASASSRRRAEPSTGSPARPTTIPTPPSTTAKGTATTRAPSTPPTEAEPTPCETTTTYAHLSAESSGGSGVRYSAVRELAKCGGPDDINWFPTGHSFNVQLSATVHIFVLRQTSIGPRDEPLPLVKFAAYLSNAYTGLFLVNGPITDPTTLTELYHP